MSTKTTDGWDLIEQGPERGAPTVLLLPGALCPAGVYQGLMAEPALSSVRLLAVTVPGWAGTRPPGDLSIEAYARAVGKVAEELGADVIAGHSYGANLALEAAALGSFNGPIVLLSPSLSREDEVKMLGTLDKIGSVPLIGAAVWWLAMKAMPGELKKGLLKHGVSEVSANELRTQIAKNEPGFCRDNVRHYFEYLDRHRDLAPRLCESQVKAWVVFGTDDEIKLKDSERLELEACASVTMATVEGTHMFPVETPSGTASVIAEAVAAAG